MKIDVAKILKNKNQTIEFDFDLSKGDIKIHHPDIKSIGPMHVGGNISNNGDNLILTGDITAEIELICSRCMQEFIFKIDNKIFQPFAVDRDQIEQQNVYPIEDQKIDIIPLIKENILLELPIKPVCRDDCKGLCQYCGKNLNYGECDCSQYDDIDVRFSALKDLFKDDKEVEAYGGTQEKDIKGEKK